MIIKTRIFELCNGRYKNLSELARAMEISISQAYRVREGRRNINQKFIIGAKKAFPEYKLDELFYLTPELPTVTISHHQGSIEGQVAKEEQRTESTQQALKKFTSAIDEYGQHLQSHTSALISLRQASQELKDTAEKVDNILCDLIRNQSN